MFMRCRIAGNFLKVFIFGYFEEALLFENKFSQVKTTIQLSVIRLCIQLSITDDNG